MPVGGETIIAGEYTATWNAVALGIFRGDDGFPTLSQAGYHVQAINNTSKYGQTMIDGVYRGVDMFAQFRCVEYRAGPIAAWWPFSTIGRLGIIGRLIYDMSAAMVWTAIAGTPAAASPATLTSSKTILAPGFPTELVYGPMVREVPIRLALLPFDAGAGVVAHWTQT